MDMDTDVQIYVELEVARLTHILAHIKEEEGDLAAAADLMEDIQVRMSAPLYTMIYG